MALVMGCAAVAHAAGSPLAVTADARVDASVQRRVTRLAGTLRPLRTARPLPEPAAASAEDAANAARVEAIALALERARRHESEAAWDACAREAAGALGDAIELLAATARFDLLRELHLQIGVCMSLSPQAENAAPHFVVATLLDESPPPVGRHRQEAEQARERVRAAVLARSRGQVKIQTDPPGARVWLDGRRIPGTTPLVAEARLGDHFVTIRRFRYEPRSERRVLQPGSRAHFVLDPARRRTLRRQLGEVKADRLRPSPAELDLARAAWSGADQLLRLSAPKPRPGPVADRGSLAMTLVDVTTGEAIRRRALDRHADDEQLRAEMCSLLGESCHEPEGGIPWYVWPLGGAALVGAAVAIGFAADAARPVVFCPSTGCD